MVAVAATGKVTYRFRDEGARGMTKSILVAAVGLTLLSVDAVSAQTADQCGQVRAAVAQYGYKAAKAHADATLSPEEVRAASTCLKRKPEATKRHSATTKHRPVMKEHQTAH